MVKKGIITGRNKKFPLVFWPEKTPAKNITGDKKESKSIPECPKEEPVIEEARIEKEVFSEITPTYEVQWDEERASDRVIKILVSDENFLKTILEELNRNIKSEIKFRWSPAVWREDPERTTINAIAKINKNDIAELKNFIDEIESSYNISEIQK
ncbi:hypothetical protein GQ568_01855 [Patescibacteria group bacterium]|nr:hypothetical protein [Patescibacteria group bacterium]